MSDTRVPMAAMQDVRSLVVMLIDSEIANATDPTWEAMERHGHDVIVEAFNRIRQQVGGPCNQRNCRTTTRG